MGKKKYVLFFDGLMVLELSVFRKQSNVPKLPNKPFVQLLLIFLISSTQKPTIHILRHS